MAPGDSPLLWCIRTSPYNPAILFKESFIRLLSKKPNISGITLNQQNYRAFTEDVIKSNLI